MGDPTTFSVIIPSFNRASLIRSTVESALNQEYRNFEVVVVDDGSTDDTRDVVSAIDDEHVRYLRKENSERGAARNFGVKHAKGRYVTFLDSDDRLFPDHLSTAARLIAEKGCPEVFHLGYQVQSPQGEVLTLINNRKGQLNDRLLEGNSLSCIGVFIRRDIAGQHPFSEERKLSGSEDWLLWLQLAARYEFHFSNAVTAAMIDHPNRSVRIQGEAEMRCRRDLLIEALRDDEVFMKRYDKNLKRVRAHMDTYIALHMALAGYTIKPFKYLASATALDARELFKRRTLAVVKHSVRGLVGAR